MKKLTSFTLFLLIIFLFLCGSQLFAAEEKAPELVNIIITTSAEDLLVFAKVQDGFNKKMLQGVKNGLPISFTFHIELDRVRTWWFNDNLASYKLTRTLTYDALKKEYEISFSKREDKVITTRSVSKAKQLMSRLNSYPLVKRTMLIPDAPYTLRIKVTLAESRLPLGMHYILPFISLWDFETDWRTVKFHY